MRNLLRTALLASVVLLGACDSSEERAAKHFQNGVELLESGDTARAIVEFRNALALDQTNAEAYRLYARASRQSGNTPEAYSNFLALSELKPEDAEARVALAEMAFLAQSWDEAARHVERLRDLDGEFKGRDVVDLADRFRHAVVDDDKPAIGALVSEAETLVADNPGNPVLERVLIEGYLSRGNLEEAIRVTEAAIERGETNQVYFIVLADLLAATEETERLEAHLKRSLEVFPDDMDIKRRLVALYVRDGKVASAEDFLRSEIESADDKVAAQVNLIALIRELRGDEAAMQEIEAAIQVYEGNSLLQALKAGMMFDRGQQEEAISLMQSIVDAAEQGDETDRYRVTLAKMLAATGNEVGARTLVEQVLEHDPGQVEALKMQAARQIEDDQADAAIASLRNALDQSPNDAEAMTLMARAHERNGDKQLAQDLLSLAVEASRNAPAESLRLANALIAQERYRPAEEVLVAALRRQPGERNLLTALGKIYLETEDWSRAEQVAATLRRIDTPAANAAADEMQLRIISSRQGRDQGIAYLEQIVGDSAAGENGAARIALIRARLSEQKTDEALALAMELVDELPGDQRARMVLGNTQLAVGDVQAAEATFQGILDETPDNGLAAIQLVRVMGAQGRVEDAYVQIEKGLEVNPTQPDLLWAKASYLERDNDIDGAIEVYETLYELNSNSPIIANNLASLIATYRDDDASLERAFAVGRRLRGTDVPQFQDTYGWLLHRRGEFEEALDYLEPSAQALSDDPIVQYHLAKTYLELGRNDEARQAFADAVALASDDDPRPQIADAKAQLELLKPADSQ